MQDRKLEPARAAAKFCGNPGDLERDLMLRVNVAAVQRAVGNKYDGVPVEDLLELAAARCVHLKFNAFRFCDSKGELVGGDKFVAIAVLEGLRGNPRQGY